MCGIFAAINTAGQFTSENREAFLKSTELISYRGPDAQGTACLNSLQPGTDPDKFNIFLGHRRLAIIDLTEGGNQPMQSDDYFIIYNGEIFNYLELREELRKSGHLFKTDSDTEVILKIYAAYGSSGFSKLNGMWAFVLIDLKKNIAVCSRDRFSIKPLYYLREGDKWYFGSEIKQLLPFLKEKKLNTTLTYNFIRQQLLEHTNETFLSGINKVPAKSSLTLDLTTGEYNIDPYWNYEPESGTITLEDATERFHQLLDDSIRIRMRSDVQVGALLSGGLDSSAITVLADRYSNGSFSTFSVVSDERKFSEENFIDLLVKHHPHPNYKLRFKSEFIPESIDRVLFHQDQPFASLSIVAQYLMFQQIKSENDIKVILSGQGGDEILMGYLKYYFFNLIENKRKHRYGQLIREVMGSFLNRTVLWQLQWNEVKRYIPRFAGSAADFILLQDSTEAVWKFNSLLERQQQDIDHYSVPVLAHYEDRNSMAASIESRLPFLDHRLVSFLVGLPVHMKMKNGWTKYVLRKSMNELPDGIRWRRTKLGFDTPDAIWLKNQLAEMVRMEFQNSSLHNSGIIDKFKFLDYFQSFKNGNQKTDPFLIFRIYILEKWHKSIFNS